MRLKEVLIRNKWFLLVVCLATLWFIWYETRPMLIRQSCQQLARERGNEYFSYSFLQNETALRKSQLQAVFMNQAYERCLHDKGIDK